MITAIVIVIVAAISFYFGWKMRGSDNNVQAIIDAFNAEEPLEEGHYDYELSHNERPDELGIWFEVEIQNKCGHGCKIYEHKEDGTRILWHSSAYGCRQ